MAKDYIVRTAGEIAELKQARELYKKRFWIHSRSMDKQKRKSITKLFVKIDRLRNHLKLWLKQLANNKPSNHDSYVKLIERGKNEIDYSFRQLDKELNQTA